MKDRAERRRAEILQAAGEVFATQGYHSAKIADIAQRLGLGHGTFYRYFENKRDIFCHVIDRAMGQISEVIAPEDPQASNTLSEYQEQVSRLSQRLFELFQGDPNLSRLLFVEAMGIDDEIADKVQLALGLASQLTEAYLRNGQVKGFLRADLDVRTTALAINAMTFEGARQVVRANDPAAERDRWLGAVSTLMFSGLAVP